MAPPTTEEGILPATTSPGEKLEGPFLGAFLDKVFFRYLRRLWVIARIFPPFLKIFFTKQGLGSHKGRTLIWGKFRRSWLSLCPPLVRHLQKKHGMQGSCTSCGASCNLLFQCPHWDTSSHLCGVYEDRPDICRHFPVTPSDIRDRSLILEDQPCGFTFETQKAKQ